MGFHIFHRMSFNSFMFPIRNRMMCILFNVVLSCVIVFGQWLYWEPTNLAQLFEVVVGIHCVCLVLNFHKLPDTSGLWVVAGIQHLPAGLGLKWPALQKFLITSMKTKTGWDWTYFWSLLPMFTMYGSASIPLFNARVIGNCFFFFFGGRVRRNWSLWNKISFTSQGR